MRVLTLIPARGGSKGVPGKNRKSIHGKPLIEYTLDVAIESPVLTEIWVSSDDVRILELAGKFPGINVHNRHADLATDTSAVSLTLAEVNRIAASRSGPFEALMILQPTSPIRSKEFIEEAVQLLSNDPTLNSVISVCAMDDVHPARMYWKKDSGVHSVLPEYEQNRRQDVPKVFYRNGSIYLVRTSAFLQDRSVMAKPTALLEMPNAWLLNIDTPRDVLIAEALIPAWKAGMLK